MNTFHTDVFVLTGNLFKLERCGKYEEALAELRHIWEDTNLFPAVNEFAPRVAAEIILRCGALIGFLGHNKQIPNSQEKSKNLLTEAHKRFRDIYDVEKIVECENYLALAYWRMGELTEAETWIEEALSHSINKKSDAWIYSNLTKSIIYIALAKYEEAEKELKSLEKHVKNFGNYFFLGSFCTNLAVALRNLGKIPEALKYYESARYYHQKSGHRIYLGTIENNLAYLYKSEHRFKEAHQAIDNGVEIFKEVKDRTREGFSLDTKAHIFLDEGKYSEALDVIEKAIFILRKSENAGYVVETYLSKAKILAYLGNTTAAFLCLSDGVQLAKTKISEEKAENLVEEFLAILEERTAPVISKTFSEKETGSETLELILHPTIAHYGEFHGVWIKNSHLESFGLQKGSLAVVTKSELKRGDLVAVNEIETDSVMCGFYDFDADFGLVCLEGIGEEPRFFNEAEIEILGKIVGVGKTDKNSKGKIEVKPLNL
jgi:tetratricopeptide (TPR) repeat protein